MHAGKKFGLMEALLWTRRDILTFIILSTIPTTLYVVFDIKGLALPWVPIALIGTAVAFIIGFKNNASYDRLWEARKIWGGIVNDSRTWAIMVKDFVSNKHASKQLSDEELYAIHSRLIHRHLGWITALRFQLRQPRNWENITQKHNAEYKKYFRVAEEETPAKDVLNKYLSQKELDYVLSKKNQATQIINLQSQELRLLLVVATLTTSDIWNWQTC